MSFTKYSLCLECRTHHASHTHTHTTHAHITQLVVSCALLWCSVLCCSVLCSSVLFCVVLLCWVSVRGTTSWCIMLCQQGTLDETRSSQTCMVLTNTSCVDSAKVTFVKLSIQCVRSSSVLLCMCCPTFLPGRQEDLINPSNTSSSL